MSKMQIITNNHWRTLVYGFELPEKVRAEFSNLDDIEGRAFIEYKGEYFLDEFFPISDNMRFKYPETAKWEGYLGDSFFSGLLIRYSEDLEQYQIATYIV